MIINIVRYLQDFKEYFPALYHVRIGKFFPHITTEVDCKSMFSQAGFISEPRRSRIGIHMHERRVVGNYCLYCIHYSIPIVKELFMKQRNDNSWEEEDDQDKRAFLTLEK